MPDNVLRTEQIWMFGKRYDFDVYATDLALDGFQYQGGLTAAPTRRQKNQIVLHYTAGAGRARATVDWWNTLANLPHFICPRWFNNPPHHYGAAAAGACPAGHGALVKGQKYASAQYVLERAQHRETPAAHPYADVVEVTPSDYVAFHGGVVNRNSVGIEISNVGWNFAIPTGDATTGAGAAQRPVDQNRWLHLAVAVRGQNDFEAYQEEQYLALLLLLRHLCIRHRIPRQFLGNTTEEKMARWWHNLPAAEERLTRSRLLRFRGILSHMNCHEDKACGGPALHRNRLFRGITDEWWLPVQLDGSERTYYMGPFDPQPNVPSFFRWEGGALQAHLFHDANLDALQETRSYFDLEQLPYYYAYVETAVPGGHFPIGRNKVWHGGIHFAAPAGNRKVYAAASGTIVAARLGGNAATEANPSLGSQRFVLIRHCVHLETEPDPGGGRRINYTAAPKYVFTLYMHLAAFADVGAANNANPPWFNYWLRHKRRDGDDPNAVFCPEVEVAVGDWLGECGTFRSQRLLHFEVVSREELSMSPWHDAQLRIHDPDSNAVCDAAAINRFVTDRLGDGIDTLDILRGARRLRDVKSYHKSEWALTSADAFAPVIRDARRRGVLWPLLRPFMWVADAVAACPDLTSQLCDANGMMWHYHPLTFMGLVNQLVLAENRQVNEPDLQNTNVTMENGYLKRFVTYAGGVAQPALADAQVLRPFDISDTAHDAFHYHFTRLDLACRSDVAPPNETRFNLALLDVLEGIRMLYNASLRVHLAHVCAAHNVAANANACIMGTVDGLAAHALGHAVDVSPANPNPARCRDVWRAARAVINRYNPTFDESAGEPSRGDLPAGFARVDMATTPAIQAKLEANQALTAAEAAAFRLHLELVEGELVVRWECWLRRRSRATAVRVHDGGVLGVYATSADATAERAAGTTAVDAAGLEGWLKRPSRALRVKLHDGGVIGVYASREDAEAEKERDFAWPKLEE